MTQKERKTTYLKLGHLILNHLLRSNNWNTAIFYTIAYLILASSPIKAFIGTFEVCLLQHSEIQKFIVRKEEEKEQMTKED
jgi:predicted transcriptional regulator